MIILLNKQRVGFTDSTGRFIARVPVGTFTVRASQIPFRNTDVENVRVAADSTTNVDFVLTRPEDDAPVFTGAYVACDDPYGGDPEKESLVQIGVRSEKREGKQLYTYRILNRSRLTLSEIRIGFDASRDHCELTGDPPHAVPDTAFGPPGWVCVPIQGSDSTTYALACRIASGQGGREIPSRSFGSDFVIAVRGHDAQYAKCHWLALAADSQGYFAGRVRPRSEVDGIPMTTGTIAGSVMDQAGAPLSGAEVRLWHAGPRAICDSTGAYTLRDVPVGEYTMVARGGTRDPGDAWPVARYENCWKNGVRVGASRASKADFHLSAGMLLIPCTAYTSAPDRLDVPFPSDAIDTRGARFLNAGEPIPSKRRGESQRPYIYSLTNRDVEIVYRGLGEDTVTRAFVARVHREFRSPQEERLLRIAEEVYPPTKAVVSLADDRLNRKALLTEKRLWWYGEFDGVRLPYAVTLDAVRYYLAMTQAFGKGDRTKFRMKQSDFSYSARISPGPTTFTGRGQRYENVYVVTLSLEWSDYCGSLCACGFGLDRTVLLRSDGTLVCVFGDRKPSVIVS